MAGQVVLINPRSGGLLGAQLYQSFARLLHPLQVRNAGGRGWGGV